MNPVEIMNPVPDDDVAIAEIASATSRPKPIVKRVYDAELARLRSEARLPEFVSLFASRRTKEILLAQPITNTGPIAGLHREPDASA